MKKTIVAALFLSMFLADFSSIKAATTATTTLSGGGSLRGEYDIHRSENNDYEEWDLWARAFLSLNHSRHSENGGLSFNYGQTISYNFRTEEISLGDSDLRMNINTWRNLSSRLRFNLSDTLIRTIDYWGESLSSTATGIPEPDDPLDENEEDTTSDPEFSVKLGREKFWSNFFSTGLSYQYAKSGTIALNYSNRILKYDDDDFFNYKTDSLGTSLSYGFNAQWNTSLSYRYTDAQYEDINQDFITHFAGLNLNYVHSVKDTFSAGLNYYEKEYDHFLPDIQIGRSDFYAVRGSLGWSHNFSPLKSLSMSVGPAYLNYVDQDPYTTTYFDINYTSIFENGSWYIGATGGFDDRSFDGRNEGVSEYQLATTSVSWVVAKDLSAGLGANMRTDDFLENPLNSDDQTYNAFANLSYRINRWFYVSGRYWYVRSETELNINDYTDHRFYITLGASKELYRWIH